MITKIAGRALALSAGLAALALATPAYADTVEASMAGTTFVEIGAGMGQTHAGEFEFINPNGADYIKTFPVKIPFVSTVVGNDIVLDQQRRDASSPAFEASLGHFLGDRLYVRATYRYLGKTHYSGSAAFPIDPSFPPLAFDQDYYMTAHAAYLGIGYDAPLSGPLFVDLSAEGGVARLSSVSRQGANLGDTLGHPRATKTNFSGGGSVGLGVRASARTDVILKARADYLGSAATGISTSAGSPDGNFGINDGEQLKLHGLVNYSVGVTLRTRF
jgi:hypothetical protein